MQKRASRTPSCMLRVSASTRKTSTACKGRTSMHWRRTQGYVHGYCVSIHGGNDVPTVCGVLFDWRPALSNLRIGGRLVVGLCALEVGGRIQHRRFVRAQLNLPA
jgi:hypothetical protein